MTPLHMDIKKGVWFSTALNFRGDADAVHTYDRFGIYLAGKTIGSPDPYVYQVQVPGRDGMLDLTDELYGSVKYKNRKLQIQFLIPDVASKWAIIYSEIADALHGKKLYVTFDEDKSYSYYGRVTINKFATARHKGTITLDVDAEPYKIYNADPYTDWLWDPFDFRSGVIQNHSWNVSGSLNIELRNGKRHSETEWWAVNTVTIVINGSRYTVQGGSVWRQLPIVLEEGITNVTIQGNGLVKCAYKWGVL